MKKKVYLARREKNAIEYMASHGAEKAICCIEKVSDTDDVKPFLELGTLCKTYLLDTSNKRLILTEEICQALTDFYSQNQKREKAFIIFGFLDGDGDISCQKIQFPKIKKSNDKSVLIDTNSIKMIILSCRMEYLQSGTPFILVGHNHTIGNSKHKDNDKICNNFSLVDLLSTHNMRINLDHYDGGDLFSKILSDYEMATIMINHIGDINVAVENSQGTLECIRNICFRDKDDSIKPIQGFNQKLGVFTDIENNYDVEESPRRDEVIDNVLGRKHDYKYFYEMTLK